MNNVIQRSDAWHQMRLGKITASSLHNVMAKTKSGYSTSRDNYMTQLLLERLNNQPTEFYINDAMQRGIDLESVARAKYELFDDNFSEITEVGFIDHPTIKNYGASPDGLINDDGLIEIKCPNQATHLLTVLNNNIDRKYILQMHAQMMCTGRKWCDFVSFDDRFPLHLQLKIIRVNFDEALAKEIEYEVIKFNKELEEKLNKLKKVA